MKNLILLSLSLGFLTSCSSLPQFYSTLDDIADSAVEIKIDKSALQKDTDLGISVTVSNKNAQTVK